MSSKSIMVILLLYALIISISGCTTKNVENGTFGEKSVTINNVTIINNVTADHYEDNGTNHYYIDGFLKNNNNYDVFNLKMKATFFDADGNVVGENVTVYLYPKVISTRGESRFYFELEDPDKKIVRYELKLISVSAAA